MDQQFTKKTQELDLGAEQYQHCLAGWLDGRLVERPCWPGVHLAGRVPPSLAGWPRNWIQKLDQEIGRSNFWINLPK